MDDSSPQLPEPFLLLWLLGALLAVLACHLALGYARQARRQPARAGLAVSVTAGALAWGTGIMAAMVLSVATTPLAFVVGYGGALLAAIWAGAVVLAAVPPWLLAWRPGPGSALIGGCGPPGRCRAWSGESRASCWLPAWPRPAPLRHCGWP
jgi:hypothetical protein